MRKRKRPNRRNRFIYKSADGQTYVSVPPRDPVVPVEGSAIMLNASLRFSKMHPEVRSRTIEPDESRLHVHSDARSSALVRI